MHSFLSKSELSFLIAVFCSLAAIPTCAETIRVTATAKQTFGGFGASQAWPGMVAFGPANTAIETQIYDAMFSSLKLSYIRLAVPPDYQPTAGGPYNIQAAVDAGHKELIDAAKARTGNGIKVFYSVWSPPGWMKANGKTTGGRGDRNNYLLYNMRDTFGRYLGSFVSDFQTAFGYPVNYLSMQNEPDVNVSYDSCVYTAAEFAATAPYVNTYVPASVFLLSPETSLFDNTYYQTVLNSAGAEFDFGCMHSYASSGSAIAAANRAQKPIWQTEFSILSDTEGGAADAASLIKNFAEDTNDGDVSVWFWWQIAGSQLNENDGEQLIIHNGAWDPWTLYTSFTLLKKWHVFRDMTVNIQPGAVNRNTISSAAYLKGAAFRNPTGKFVVVLSSGAKTSLALTLTIDELAGSGNVPFTQYRTDTSANSATSTVTFSNGMLNSSVATKSSLILVQN